MTGGLWFSFDGRPVQARPGQSLAAALTEAGVRAFRQTGKGGERGIFCGMGVCQDCLVTVDDVPNLRTCTTAAVEGLRVATQVAMPALAATASAPVPPTRKLAPDVLVIGGGAGGLSAAAAAAGAGARVVLVDERKIAGGQYYKQAAGGAPALDRQQAEGAALLRTAKTAGVEILAGTEVWGAFDGLLFLAEQAGGAIALRPPAAIVATGAYERPRMVPGWTLPGVMTTGAAQTLWRSYRTLPGRRVAVCGSGPLNLQVALELAAGGAEVALVAELAAPPMHRPLAGLGLALADPRLAAAGFGMLLRLRRAGVQVRHRTELVRVEPAGGALAATFRDEAGGETRVVVDAVLMNEGFEPQNEILRLLGAAMRYDPRVGHLRCVRGARMETSVPGLYAVGDCAGLGGAPAAIVEGRIAGRAAAAAAGSPAHAVVGTEALQGVDGADARALARHRRFQARLWRMFAAAPRSLAVAPDEVILCRCEEVTLGEFRASLAAAPGHAGSLKRATRVGMGRCQGRYCGPAVVRLVAEATGDTVEDRSFFAPRVPIKPVSIAAILAAEDALNGPP